MFRRREKVQCRKHGYNVAVMDTSPPLLEILLFQNKVGDIQAEEELSTIGALRQEVRGGIQP